MTHDDHVFNKVAVRENFHNLWVCRDHKLDHAIDNDNNHNNNNNNSNNNNNRMSHWNLGSMIRINGYG